MKLWEILVMLFFAPAFWFGWMWLMRLFAAATAAKLISGIKDKALSKLRGETDDNSGQSQM